MASLQARHSRSCPLYPWTPAGKATKAEGCDCTSGPLFHVVLRHAATRTCPVDAGKFDAEFAGQVARRRE